MIANVVFKVKPFPVSSLNEWQYIDIYILSLFYYIHICGMRSVQKKTWKLNPSILLILLCCNILFIKEAKKKIN